MPETLQEYSKDAAEAFIQTAVFIDDRIYQKREATVETVDLPQTREPAANTENTENGNRATTTQPLPAEETVSDSYKIINSFAEKGIVCSMYEPKDTPNGPEINSIIPLCIAADIVIVDWNLHGNIGDKAIGLINRLISQAIQDAPEQIRLVLVYTQEIDLVSVTERIFNAIKGLANIGDSFQPDMDKNNLAFYSGSYRVAVLGKPGRERTGIDPRHVVCETELADTAIEEFAKLAQGLLQAAILLGLAKIRNNSRKILSRFDRQLDPAFLTHRAMALDTEDALDHIVPLLVSEIESVLEDALPHLHMSDEVLKDWCNKGWKKGDHLERVYAGQGLDYLQVAKVICTEGFKTAAKDYAGIQSPYKSKGNAEKAGKFLLPSEDSDANLRFAHFMASRTFYGDNEKMLMLGSILHDRHQDQYLLCIQPVCDSVRLKERRTFVFVKLHKKEGNGVKSVSHVIVKPDNSIVELLYKPNSYECFSTSFDPNENLKIIIARTDNQDELYFEDIRGNRYYWIGQLRTSHAQDAVGRFASNISRVGLTESEWLRLLAKK